MLRLYAPTLLLLSLFFSLLTKAETPERLPRVVENTTLIGYGFGNISDSYLSPFNFTGDAFSISSQWQKQLYRDRPEWIQQYGIYASGATYLNSISSNAMMHLTLQGNYGIFYRKKLVAPLQLWLGGVWDANIGGKLVGRNVNKPGSADVHTHLNAAAALHYTFGWKQVDFRVRYQAETPVVGVMFVPEMGASYYELFDLFILDNAIHLSSWHNTAAIQHELLFDIRLPRSTWSIGAQHHYRYWQANYLQFHQHSIHFVVGVVTDIVSLTKKNRNQSHQAPFVW